MAIEPFRFVHASDLHLDRQLEGLDSYAEHLRTVLEDATLMAFERVIDLCLTEDVDFLLLAGDSFDASAGSLRAQFFLQAQLQRLAEREIPALIVTGAGDPPSGWNQAMRLPETVHRFRIGRVEAVPVTRDGREIARVYGISLPPGMPATTAADSLAERFPSDDDGAFGIALLHGGFATLPGSVPDGASVGPHEAPAEPAAASAAFDKLAARGIRYWALGHAHERMTHTLGTSLVHAPGNPQGLGPWEPGPRGCTLVSVDAEGRVHPRFQPTDVVRWSNVEVTVDPPFERGDLESALRFVLARVGPALPAAAEAAHPETAIEKPGFPQKPRCCEPLVHLVACRLTGDGPLFAELLRGAVLDTLRDDARTLLDDLLAWLREQVGTGTPPVWVHRLDIAPPPLPGNDVVVESRIIGEFLTKTLELAGRSRAPIGISADRNDSSATDLAPGEQRLRIDADEAHPDVLARAGVQLAPCDEIIADAFWLGCELLARPEGFWESQTQSQTEPANPPP